MAFLRIESAISGAWPNTNQRFSYSPGDVVEWDDATEAARLVERGIAEEIIDEGGAKKAAMMSGRAVKHHKRPPEAAMRKPAEKAMPASPAIR